MLQIGLIGYGTVGSGVYERLSTTSKHIEQLLGEEIKIVGILVKDRQKKRALDVDAVVTTNWEEFCQIGQYDIIFEAIGGIEPAFSYTAEWLQRGIPVITANKKLVAEKGSILEKMAEEQSTYYGYEAAVAGGIPIINALKGTLMTTSISRVAGILNGTTNYMLTEMIENQRSFTDVLIEAQQLGYAEADPTDDIEGYDAWYKIRILSHLCFGEWPTEETFSRKGVSEIEDWHVEIGERFGFKIKLIGEACVSKSEVKGRVTPAFLTLTEPLANVRGVMNGITLEGKSINELLFIGPGAGKEATSNSMVEDFIFHERVKSVNRTTNLDVEEEKETIAHALLFIKHSQREEALDWVKDQKIAVIDTCDHPEGEGWIICEKNLPSPFKEYPIYGDVALRKRTKTMHSTQFGAF
ncbi:homoserine dehydrogenase [Halalkalibacter alkalisediminis]|uniref:Homoserine dehydrogenase n=1 Tax=Halalkalibacter alkalisediminis TaxID=935616 RepID=A0ABV6NME1_9BACI|nr:homoserine dehydrogenase [Halalkalibacter alkalisediminis]